MRSLAEADAARDRIALAQSSLPVDEETDIYRNDLPETHQRISLPQIDEPTAVAVLGDAGGDAGEALATVSAGSVAAQQFGNLAASKQASGVVRDLGDVMILLHSAINDRLGSLSQGEEQPAAVAGKMSEADHEALDAARLTNGSEFNVAFPSWISSTYPQLIEAWDRSCATPRA